MTIKGKKQANAGEPVRECRGLMGVYMTNWPSWFEVNMGGYRRTGGLEFVRLFVSAGGTKSTESSQFLQLLTVLRTISPERYHHNLGVYFGLVALTATLQRCYRGWLLDEALKPLADKGMAQRLFVDPPIMRQSLKDLYAAGLIQRMPLPEFDPSADEEERIVGAEPKSKARARAEKPRKTRRAKGVCKDLQTFAKGAEPLIKGKDELTTDQGEREIPNGQVAKGEGQAPTSPAAAPPEGQGSRPWPARPQDVTGGQPRHSSPSDRREPATAAPGVSTGPRIVPLHQDGDASPIGHLLPRAMDGLAHGQAVRTDEFACEIFALLRAPFDANSRDGARELGNYRAAWLDAIDAGLSSQQMEELRAKARKDAGTIGGHRKRFYARDGSPEQYWRFLFNKHLDARRRGKPEARAGPGSAAAV